MRFRTSLFAAVLVACTTLSLAQDDGAGQAKAKALLAQMVQALGGDAWLNRKDWYYEGQNGYFYRGAPTGQVTKFWSYNRRTNGPDSDEERVEYTKKRDIVQIFTAKGAVEITFRGKTDLPEDAQQDLQRRRAHTIDKVVVDWLKLPGTMVVSEGTTMVQRRVADKVTVISPTNDAVTIELDESTHLPLARTFQYRNEKYKDFDVDREEYDGYHDVQGLPTAYTITRFKNGDMVSQKFYTEVKYAQGLSPALFDVEETVKEKQKVGKK